MTPLTGPDVPPPPTVTGPQPIPYRAARPARRRGAALISGLVAVAAVSISLAVRWEPSVKHKLSFLFAQRSVLRQPTAPDQLALLLTGWGHYESGDSVPDAKALLETPDYTAAFDYDRSGETPVLPYAIGRARPAVDRLLEAAGQQRTMSAFTRVAPLLFFARLPSPAGDRLLALSYRGRSTMVQNHARQEFRLTADLYRPATLRQPLTTVASQPCDVGYFDDRNGRAVLRVNAGRVDPADPAAFTFSYTLDGVPGTIAGRLQPGGAAIDLAAHDGPLNPTGP